jgi:hypothetical protein
MLCYGYRLCRGGTQGFVNPARILHMKWRANACVWFSIFFENPCVARQYAKSLVLALCAHLTDLSELFDNCVLVAPAVQKAKRIDLPPARHRAT